MRRFAVALLGLGVGVWLLAGCGNVAARSPAAPNQAVATPSAAAAPVLRSATPAEALSQSSAPTAILETPPEATLPADATSTPEAPALAMADAITATTPTRIPPSATPNPNLVLRTTPTEPPTPDPNLGVGAVLYDDEFDGDSGWTWPYVEDDIAAFSLGGDRLNAVMKVGSVSGPRLVAGQPAQQIGDQQLQVTTLTNLCYAKDEYGVLFRANASATDGYLFTLSCEGKARAAVLHNLKPAVLVDWTASSAIMRGAPAENTLLVWASGAQLNFFINGKHLFSAVDKTFAQGTYGFYVYDRTNGGESVSFDKLVVKSISLP